MPKASPCCLPDPHLKAWAGVGKQQKADVETKTSPSGVTQGHGFPWYLRFHTWAVTSRYSKEFYAAYISHRGSSQAYPALNSNSLTLFVVRAALCWAYLCKRNAPEI